jgi:hypothetical protein
MGDQIYSVEKLVQLQGFSFRPRPNSIMTKKQISALKKDYRNKYAKRVKEEATKDTNAANDET